MLEICQAECYVIFHLFGYKYMVKHHQAVERIAEVSNWKEMHLKLTLLSLEGFRDHFEHFLKVELIIPLQCVRETGSGAGARWRHGGQINDV